MRISKKYQPEKCVAKDAERHNLTDPYLDVARERVIATNGHLMVALPVETEKTERSRYLAVNLLKAARTLGDPDDLAEIDDQEIKPFGVLWPAEQMGRDFPDWRAVLPKFGRGEEGTLTIALNAELLRKLSLAMGTGGPVAVTVLLGDPEGPILVQPPSVEAEEIGVLMPMRADGAGEVSLGRGQICPKCMKILASGAHCPVHGDPLAEDEDGDEGSDAP